MAFCWCSRTTGLMTVYQRDVPNSVNIRGSFSAFCANDVCQHEIPQQWLDVSLQNSIQKINLCSTEDVLRFYFVSPLIWQWQRPERQTRFYIPISLSCSYFAKVNMLNSASKYYTYFTTRLHDKGHVYPNSVWLWSPQLTGKQFFNIKIALCERVICCIVYCTLKY